MSALTSADIHARVNWPAVLEQLGVPGIGSKKPTACPACGGVDRFVGDNRRKRGDYFCRQCGAGDGFTLLMKVHGWTFTEARKRVLAAAGITSETMVLMTPAVTTATVSSDDEIARPTGRVRAILRSACAIADCADAVAYLESRNLWPLPQGCTLRAHPSVDYFHNGRSVGRFAALVAAVRDIHGEPVTAHLTYLRGGRKLADREPRKILSPLTGRVGCAVRLMPITGDLLGIGEGIETCLAAAQLHSVPMWAALNTALLTKFEPPEPVRTLIVFGDRDAPGLEAAARLMERLQGRVRLKLRVPATPAKDWNDIQMKVTAA